MSNFEALASKAIYKFDLSGGQNRLKEAILYICNKASDMEYFGAIKLNKILWRADFRSYALRLIAVTGRQYQRLPMGPVPVEIPPVINELLRDDLLLIERRNLGKYEEKRHIAKVKPVLRMFSQEDIDFIDEAIEHYRWMSGTETSDESHGIAWRTRENGEPIPYQAAFFEDAPLSHDRLNKLAALARAKSWQSQ